MCYTIELTTAALLLGVDSFAWSLALGGGSWRYGLVASFIFYAMIMQTVDLAAWYGFWRSSPKPKADDPPLRLRGQGLLVDAAALVGFLLIATQSTLILVVGAFFHDNLVLRWIVLAWVIALDAPQIVAWLLLKPNRSEWLSFEVARSEDGLFGMPHYEICWQFFVATDDEDHSTFWGWYFAGARGILGRFKGRSFFYSIGTTAGTALVMTGVASESDEAKRIAMYVSISVIWANFVLSWYLTYTLDSAHSGRVGSVWCWTVFSAGFAAVVPLAAQEAALLWSYVGSCVCTAIVGYAFGHLLKQRALKLAALKAESAPMIPSFVELVGDSA